MIKRLKRLIQKSKLSIGKTVTGFTLAEVLITLTIIGVIAALTIPALIQNVQDTQFKTAYRKAYSIASQAWLSALNNNEIISTTGGDGTITAANFNAFENHFSVVKNCPANSGLYSNCWTNGEVFGGGSPYNSTPGFVDTSGMNWSISQGAWNYILVDTNGFKGPNKYGRDRFILLCEASDGTGDGLPVKIGVNVDFPNVDNVWCKSGGCYYRSWLKQ